MDTKNNLPLSFSSKILGVYSTPSTLRPNVPETPGPERRMSSVTDEEILVMNCVEISLPTLDINSTAKLVDVG